MKDNDCYRKVIWILGVAFSLMVTFAKAEILFTENWDSGSIDANVWSVTGNDIVLKNLGDGDYALAMIGAEEGGSPSWSDYIYSVASYNTRYLIKGKDLRVTYKVWYKRAASCGFNGGFYNSDGNSVYINPEATVGYLYNDFRANEYGDPNYHGLEDSMENFSADWLDAFDKAQALMVRITLDKDKGAKWEYSANGGMTWTTERNTMGTGDSNSITNYIGFGPFSNQNGTAYIDDIEVSTVFTEDWDIGYIRSTYWQNTDSNGIVVENLGSGDYALAMKGQHDSWDADWGDHIYSTATFDRSDKLIITYKAWWKSGTSVQCGIHGGFHTNNTSNIWANPEAHIGYVWQDFRAAEYGDGSHGPTGSMSNFTDDWVYATSKANSILIRITLDPNNGAKWQYSNNGGVTWIVERDTLGDGNSVNTTNYIGFGPFDNQWGTTMIDDITVETSSCNDELAYNIEDLSEYFKPGDNFEASRWIFVPEANVARLSTLSHPDQVLVQADGGQDIKGILRNAITIDEYSLPWEFKLALTQNHRIIAGLEENGQNNAAVGLNLAVTFSDPNTWPSDRTSTPPNTKSFQLFNVHLGARGTGLPQLLNNPHFYRTTDKDNNGEVFLVYGRGDLAQTTNPIHIGHWEIPYIWAGDGSMTAGPASNEIYFLVIIKDKRYIYVGIKFGEHPGGFHRRVIDCYEFGDITGIWEIGPIFSYDNWIKDTLCPDMNIPNTPVTINPVSPNFPSFIDYCTFQEATPISFDKLSDDFNIRGSMSQWMTQPEDIICETWSNPGYMTWTLLGGDEGTGIAPSGGDLFSLDIYPPPWEMEVCFLPPEDKIPWNFFMNFTMETNNGKSLTWYPGVRYDTVDEKHSPMYQSFNVTWADSNEPNETLMSSRPLYMLVQWLDVNEVRYGFRADPNDDWNLSEIYDYTELLDQGEYIDVFKQADWSTETRSYDGIPKYTQILIDYIYYRLIDE